MTVNRTLNRPLSSCCFLLFGTSLFVACVSGDSENDTGKDERSQDGDESGLTGRGVSFWDDVAPIYYKNCVQCHQAGGIAPFTLDDYESAKKWGLAAKAAVEGRTMPPWLVTSDGSCGDFKDSMALSDEEIQTIADWVEGEMQEGEERSLEVRQAPRLESGVDFKTPDFVPQRQGGELAKYDEYRCFSVDPKLDEDKFMVGYDVIPGNDAIVHHVLAIVVDPEAESDIPGKTNAEVMADLDAESPDREGWPCFGAAGDNVDIEQIPVSWAPGQGVVHYPENTGVRVPAGAQIVIQMHYNLADEKYIGQSDTSTLRLAMVDEVEREGFFDLLDPLLDSIEDDEPTTLEPGKESVKYSFEIDYEDIGIPVPYLDIYGVMPHMHEYGRKFSMEVHTEEQDMCAMEVPRWDFNWQRHYYYETPFRFGPGDSFEVTCDYDTRTASEEVWPGWGTRNEMCLAAVYFVVPE